MYISNTDSAVFTFLFPAIDLTDKTQNIIRFSEYPCWCVQ